MNHISKYIVVIATMLSLGCIKNDIPYPILKGDITAFDVSGQLETPQINAQTRNIVVKLADTVNLKQVEITNFQVSNEAATMPDISTTGKTVIDLSSTYVITLTTYQEYIWTITAEQNIVREIIVDNQVGETLFDIDTKTAVVSVAKNQPLNDITVLSMKLGPSNATMTPDPLTVKDFTLPQKFVVKYHDITEEWSVRVMRSDVDIITGAANPWARFAYVDGSFVSGSGSPTFEYRKSSESNWTALPQADITVNGGAFSAKISGLEPSTTYVFRSVVGANRGSDKSFTTETARQMPNMSFDEWFKDGATWYPDKDLSAANYWWDSGNKGANTLKEVNPTSPEETVVVSGKAVKMTSTVAAGIFAAGSVYLGKFIKAVISPLGADLEFGRPYTDRPTKLKGHYFYKPGIIDKASEKYASFKNTQDSCSIYAILADWDAPFQISTAKGVFVKLDDPHIIAYGELKESPVTPMSGYIPFTINLEYRSLTRKPKYLIIVASASKYGDYFTGSTSSVLYIDQFEFEFD